MADDKDVSAASPVPGGFVMPELKKSGDDVPQAAPEVASRAAEEEDDTRTRRTVKLSSLQRANPADDFPELNPVPPVAEVSTDSGVISDPLGPRSTDTGGVGMVNDTRTRKTLVVKPLTPREVRPLQPSDLPPSGAPEVPNLIEDTRTRKTLKLAAMTPGAPQAGPGVVQAPSRASEVDDTVKLQRPTPKVMPGGLGAPTSPGVGVSLPKTAPARAVDPSRQTVKLEQMAEAESQPEAESGDGDNTQTRAVAPLNLSKATIKLKPSDLPTGATPLTNETAKPVAMPAPAAMPQVNLVRTAPPPKPTTAPSEIAPPPAAAPAAIAAATAATAAATAATTADRAAAAAEPPANAKRGVKRTPPGKKVALPQNATLPEGEPALKADQVYLAAPSSNRPSPFYAAVAVAVFLLMAFSTMLTVLQYINQWEPTWTDGKRIDVPMVDNWINK